MTVAPPANAKAHSPRPIAWAARCRATRDEEHAVSTVRAGPFRPKVYAIRPEATLPALPRPRYPSTCSGVLASRRA
ncbi:hypothetical protein VT52_006825 [Streptomyces malaysiense]|uniref:Uncharacterized protein n=1 Tax=Streptomyces malaysiense TaxID=1428626 RepID=A0A1J4Q7M4_9ACTN|nr:hypothetical protein VT52_006825 [Streptomyces malaysiense]